MPDVVIEQQSEAEAEVEEVSSTLDEGLKSCHHVVAEYRSLLASVSRSDTLKAAANDQAPENGPSL